MIRAYFSVWLHRVFNKMPESDDSFPANEEVYEAFRDFFRKLISDVSLEKIPIQYKRLKTKKGETQELVVEPVYRGIESFGRHNNRYENIDRVVETLLNADYYPHTHEHFDDNDIPVEGKIINDLLDTFWNLYIRNTEVLVEFDELAFDWVFEKMEEYLMYDKIPYRAWVFLQNFRMESEVLKITENLRIREIEQKDTERVSENKHPVETYLGNPMYPTYILECEHTAPKSPYNVREYPEMEFDRVETALRLFKPQGTPEYHRGFVEPDIPFVAAQTVRASIHSGRSGIRHNVCELDREEESDFVKFFLDHNSLIKTETDGMFSRCLRRLNQMNEKSNDADCIVDCAIAFEETILKTVTQDTSFTFRLGLRGSLLLDNRVEYDRDEIRSFFKALYHARGKIVHSDKPLSEIVEEEDFELETTSGLDSRGFVQHARAFLAEVIKEYMRNRTYRGISIGDLNEEMDQAVYEAKYESQIK